LRRTGNECEDATIKVDKNRTPTNGQCGTQRPARNAGHDDFPDNGDEIQPKYEPRKVETNTLPVDWLEFISTLI
jgi:hypothetical protein